MKLHTTTLSPSIPVLLAILGFAQVSAQTIAPSPADSQSQNSAAATAAPETTAISDQKTSDDKKKEEEKKKEEQAIRLEKMIVEDSRLAGYNMGTEVARQNNLQVVDAVSELDIETMPAQDATDILKRLPGVEVNYDQGEGGGVSIRGTPDVQSTIDGREVDTSATAGGNGRSLNPEFLPGDLLSGVYIYKTQSADQIEGGIGGLIDFKTKQPFDFPADYNGSISITGTVQQKSGKLEPDASIVFGHSWDTKIGKFGISLGLDYQDIYFVNTFAITGAYTKQPSVFNEPVVAPSGVSAVLAFGGHQRVGEVLNLQWAPEKNLVFRGGFLLTRWSEYFAEEDFTFNMPTTNNAADKGSFSLQPGTDILQSGTFDNVTASSVSLMVPYSIGTKQEFGGLTWTDGDGRLKLDISGEATQGYSNELVHLMVYGYTGTIPSFTLNIAGRPPTDVMNAYGADLSNPANYNMNVYLSEATYDLFNQGAERIDMEFKPGIPFWKSFQAGARFTDRADKQTGALGVAGLSGPASSISGLPVSSVSGVSGISSWIAPDPNQMIDDAGIRSRLGISPPPPANAQNDYYAVSQKTMAAYLRALYDFKLGTMDGDGDIGVRFVDTQIDGNSYGALPNGTFEPVVNSASYGNVLPMATVRIRPPSKKWDLRATASKVVGRPSVSDLDPALTINANGTASGGNPALKPYTAVGGDLTADWYFSRTGYMSVAYFYKSVHGYNESETASENVAGQPLQVTRPYNGGSGTIQGVEVAYNQKFTSLPGPWAGLGIDANFTDVLSTEVDPHTGINEPITGIPRDVENLNLYYSLDPWFFRIGMTRQSPTVVSLFYSAGDVLNGPEVLGGNLYVDLSIQYRIGRMTYMLNCENALQPILNYYEGKAYTPANVYNAYRRFTLGARYRF